MWTWAGLRANETLRAALGGVEGQSGNDVMVLRGAGRLDRLAEVAMEHVAPHIPDEMVDTLKFSAALPHDLAVTTLAERFADRVDAAAVADELADVTSRCSSGVGARADRRVVRRG